VWNSMPVDLYSPAISEYLFRKKPFKPKTFLVNSAY